MSQADILKIMNMNRWYKSNEIIKLLKDKKIDISRSSINTNLRALEKQGLVVRKHKLFGCGHEYKYIKST